MQLRGAVASLRKGALMKRCPQIKVAFQRWAHSESVRIVEMAPRDGLQNEPQHLPTGLKVELIKPIGGNRFERN